MHIPWTSIDNFHNFRRENVNNPYLFDKTLQYKAKVKLHGTNAAVRIKNGKVTAQSRSNDINVARDNAGFAAWVDENKQTFLNITKNISENLTIVIHGEWCGSTIQKGVALSKIKDKIFAVFAIQIITETKNNLIIQPNYIKNILKSDLLYVIPWFENGKIYNFSILGQPDSLAQQIDELNKDVDIVENCDPWVKSVFGIEGIGEGLVLYPIIPENDRDIISSFMFKAKGIKHQTVAHTKPIQISATQTDDLESFARLVVTEERCLQGFDLLGDVNIKNIGPFLKWITADVDKECRYELQVSQLNVRDALKAVANRAKNWYMNKVKTL